MDIFSLAAKLTLDSSDFDKGIEDAKKETAGFGEAWDKAKGQFEAGGKSIAVGTGILAGLGTAAFKAADGLSKNLDEIDKTSQKVGWSASAYQEWDYVLQRNGSSMSAMTMGLKTLTNKFDDAVSGGESAISAFSKLGLRMDDIKDLSQEDLFGTVITALQGMEEGAERAALANELLGRGGMELGPLLNSTAEETAALIQQVNDLGGVMSDEAVKEGAAFQDSLLDVKEATAGASASLLSELLPAITGLMNKISEFVANGGLDKIINLLKTLAPVIAAVVAGIAGFKIISGIVSLVQGFSTVFGALNAVMIANPIGLVIAGIAALIAAFVLLWNKCEGFREFWIGVWNAITEFASKAWDKIKEVFSAIGEWFTEKFTAAKEGIMESWNNVKELFTEKWNAIKDAFAAVGNWFSSTFSTAKDNAYNAWETIKAKFADRWEEIKSAFADPGAWFKGKFEDARDKLLGVWDNIKSKASKIWEDIKSGFSISDAWTWGSDMIQNFINGIKQQWENLKASISNIGQTIKDFIGFSEPKKGPLSNFHTFAPDMMKLFAEGIEDNEHLVTDQIEKSFDFGEASIGAAANGTVTASSRQTRTIIGFDIDADGLAQYLHPYIKDEDARLGEPMVV